MTNAHPRRRRVLRIAVAVAALAAVAGGTLAFGLLRPEARRVAGDDAYDGAPAALRAEPTLEGAGDVATYVVRIYSQLVAEGTPQPDPRMEWATGWRHTYDAEPIAAALAEGGGARGGSFGEATVTSVDEARPGRYKVSLDVEREAQTIFLGREGIRLEIPAAEFHPIVVLSHPGRALEGRATGPPRA